MQLCAAHSVEVGSGQRHGLLVTRRLSDIVLPLYWDVVMLWMQEIHNPSCESHDFKNPRLQTTP